MSLLIAFFLFVFFIAFAFKYGEMVSPVSAIVCLWLLLLLVSGANLSGFPPPSWETQAVFLTAIVAAVVGAFCSWPAKAESVSSVKELTSGPFVLAFLIFASPPIVYALHFMISTIISGGYDSYLAVTRWEGGDKHQVFGGGFFYSLTTVFVRPLIYAVFFYSTALFVLKINRVVFCIALFLMLTYSVVLSSRLELLIIVVSLAFAMYVSRVSWRGGSMARFLKISLFLGVGVSGLFAFSYLRAGGGVDISEIFRKYVLQYHLLGFSLFDMALSSPESSLNEKTTFGLASMPFLSFIPEQLSAFLPGGRVLSYAASMRLEMQELVQVPLLDGGGLYTNAFYTSIYLFYSDFGVFGFFLFPFAYGFCFSRAYLTWRRDGDPVSLAFVIFWVYTGYASLFFPPLVSEFYWFALFVLFGIKRLRLVR